MTEELVEKVELLCDKVEEEFTEEMVEKMYMYYHVRHIEVSIPATLAAIRMHYYVETQTDDVDKFDKLKFLLCDKLSNWYKLNVNEKIALIFQERLSNIFVIIHKNSLVF